MEQIALGGMGQVWRATDLRSGRAVAAKILRPELTGDEIFLSRLRAEAKNSQGLRHPNLAVVLDSGEKDGTGWLIMELVQGRALSDIITEKGTLSPAEILPILAQVARALQVVHDSGVVHRDVKPSNILINREGLAKLTDFGISTGINQRPLTASGMVIGTAQYLAPEQAMGNMATPAGDLYGLGIIAYEALVGRRPFSGATQVDIAFAHVNEEVPALPDAVPPQVQAIVLKLLAKKPADRPHSAREVARALDRAVVNLPTDAWDPREALSWESTGRPWSYDAQRYARVEAARRAEQEAMVAYERLGTGSGAGRTAMSCRMAFLRSELDDPLLEPGWCCGACDLCGGLDLPDAPDREQVGAARTALGRVGVELRARRQWPTGMDRLGLGRFKGRIGADRQAATGLAVGRLDGLGTSAVLRELVACASDGEVPAALRPQVLEVVDRLAEIIRDEQKAAGSDGPGREPAVVVVDSRTRPRMVRQLGHAVAARLGARALGVVGLSGQEPPQHDVGSAFRLAQVARSLTLQGWSAQALDELRERTVVLVDDWSDSGWTLTTAAFLLREAGAAAVHPFVLAQR
nr:serine/threonine-protein kinase [uncultured Actinomyces sp.]